jgi:hypothetical protein
MAAIATYFAMVSAHGPPPMPPFLSLPPSTDSLDLTIAQADLQTKIFSHGILFWRYIDNFYLLDVLLRNKETIARRDCQMAIEYGGPNGKGHGGLFAGTWTDWYSERGANVFFDIPADPTLSHNFFSFPDPSELIKLDWARVRVQCAKPSVQISPWHPVDLSLAQWTKT